MSRYNFNPISSFSMYATHILQCVIVMLYLILLMEVSVLLEQELVTQLYTTVIMDMT